MRNHFSLTLLVLLIGSLSVLAFTDDFEDGLDLWEGDWVLTDEEANGGIQSITESPGIDYGAWVDMSIAMAAGDDLNTALGAELVFWAMWDTEEAFDFWYVEISTDLGVTWTELDEIDGTTLEWTEMIYDIGGYVGNDDVRIRFRFYSDGFEFGDGIWIDDVAINTLNEDVSMPLVVHVPVSENEAVESVFAAEFTVTDPSDVDFVTLNYSMDGGEFVEADFIEQIGDIYSFEIPSANAGTNVTYYVETADLNDPANSGVTETWEYYIGEMLLYDSGIIDFIYTYTANTEICTQITPEESTFLAGAFIRFYTDPNNGLDSIDVMVWDDDGGSPGEELLDEPKAIYPVNTPEQPYILTYVDLREYAINLEADENYYIGVIYRSGEPVMTGSSPAAFNRSFTNTAGTWVSAAQDFHIRGLTGNILTEVTIEEIKTDPSLLGTLVSTSGIVTQPPNSTFNTRTEMVIQDETGYGLQVFAFEQDEAIQRGDFIEILGFTEEFGPIIRLVDFTYTIISTGNAIPDPLILTCTELLENGAMEGTWAEVTGILLDDPEDIATLANIDDGTATAAAKLYPNTSITLGNFSQWDGITFRGVITPVLGQINIIPSFVNDVFTSEFMLAPSNLTAEADEGTAIVTLLWDMGTVADPAQSSAERDGKGVELEIDAFGLFNIYRDGSLVGTSETNSFTNELPTNGTYVYTVTSVYDAGESDLSNEAEVIFTTHSVDGRFGDGVPDKYEISQLYPNPFNPELSMQFGLPVTGRMVADVYDINGRRVTTLFNNEFSAGYHNAKWNANSVSAGVYFLQLRSETGWKEIRKVVLVK